MNDTANNFLYINPRKRFLCLKCSLYSTEVLLDIYHDIFLKFRVIDVEYIVQVTLNISMRSWRLDLWRSEIKSLSKQYKNKSALSRAQLVPLGIPTICWYTMPSNCTYTLSKLYDVPVGFVTHDPYFEAVFCFICGRQRVAVARSRMICLVLIHLYVFHEESKNLAHDQHLYESYFLLLKKSRLNWSTEVRFWLAVETLVDQRQDFCFDKIMWQWRV